MRVFANWLVRGHPDWICYSLGLLLCALLGSAPFADASEETAALRLAPPLEQLARNFKPDAKAEAEVILRRTHVNLDEQLMSRAHAYVAVYINSDAAARDYSQISISFNSFYEDIALDFARVRTPDGKIANMRADATQIQSPSDENFYQDGKELLFSLPNVRKGSIIEFQYRYSDVKKIIPGQWFDSIGLHWWEDRAAGQGARADAVRRSEIDIEAPARVSLYFNSLDQFAVRSRTSAHQGRKTWHWEAERLPALELQDSMPRTHTYTPYLRISSIGQWQQIAHWSDQLVAPHLVSDAKIDALAAALAARASSPMDRVKAVYQTLQEQVRYVFAHVGRGGYEPHDASEVLTNGYGDCKDQSVLAVALLRKLGISADPALIITRARGIPDMSIPAVGFDHMIVHIPAQTGLPEIWLDTTGDKALFPGFSVAIEGQPALIVNAASQAITTLPTRAASQHFAKLNIRFDRISGNDLEASFNLELGGFFEDRLRSVWQYTPEREKYFSDMLGHLYASAEVKDLQAHNADSLWQGFSLSGRLVFNHVWAGGAAPISYTFNINQMLYLFTDLNNLYSPKERTQLYVNDPGYSLITHLEFARPSPQHQLQVKTRGAALDNRYYSLTQTGRDAGDHFVMEQTLVLKPALVSLADYTDYYQKTRRLFDNEDWSLSYQSPNGEMLEAVTQTGSAGSADYIALAHRQIKLGQYAQALETARTAVKLAPEQAEAYYVLGLAQGYNNQLPEADASFHKAESLGYHL